MSLFLFPEPDKNADKPSDSLVAVLRHLQVNLAAQRGIEMCAHKISTNDERVWDLSNNLERKSCIDWVLRVTKWATRRCDETANDEWEDVLSLANSLLAELAGKSTAGPLQRRVPLWLTNGELMSDDGIFIEEPSFAEADVGNQTWGSAILLSRKISRGKIDITGHKQCLELGCGTGLVGMTIGKMLEKTDATVVMTDYLPVLLRAVQTSARKNNLLDNRTIKLARLDWYEMAAVIQGQDGCDYIPPSVPGYMPGEKGQTINNFSKWGCDTFEQFDMSSKFDLVVAADILYEVEQCQIIPLIVDFLLKPAIPTLQNRDKCPRPRFIITAPLRDSRWAEISTFEAVMAAIPDLRLVFCHETTLADDMASWKTAQEKTQTRDVLASDQAFSRIQANDLDDPWVHRIYIFERCC